MLVRDGRRPQARSSRRRQGPPVRSPSLYHLLACRVPSESLQKNGQSSTAFYQNACEVTVRVKTFCAESVVSFSWASYNWGAGRAERVLASRIRRGAATTGGSWPSSARFEEGNGTGRRSGAGDSGAARPAVPPQRGQSAHQREPRLRHGAPGGAGQRLLPDRGALRRHHPAG